MHTAQLYGMMTMVVVVVVVVVTEFMSAVGDRRYTLMNRRRTKARTECSRREQLTLMQQTVLFAC
jgi:heme exporter protein D